MEIRIIKFFTFLAFICTAFSTQAQHPFFKQFSRSEGLPGNSVYDLLTDRNGNVWLGTNRGVVYYNRGKFLTPDQPATLKASNVITLFEDASGQLWAGTSSGQFFRGSTRSFSTYNAPKAFEELAENRIINTLTIDDKNGVYLGTVIGGGIYKLQHGQYNELSSKDNNTCSYFLQEIPGNQFIWGSGGSFPPGNLLSVQLINQAPFVIQLSNKSGFSKSSFIKLNNGSMLFAKDYEIIQFRGENVVQRGFLPQKIEALYEGSDEKIWVALNKGGLICYLTESLSMDVSSRYLGSKSITAITEDKEGNTWFGSIDEGAFMLPGKFEMSYREPRILLSDKKDEVKPVLKPDTVYPIPESLTIPIERPREVSTPPVVYISHLEINNKDTAVTDFYHLEYDENFITMNFAGFVNNHPDLLQFRYMLRGYDKDWIYTNTPHVQYSRLVPGEYVFLVYAMDNNGVWSNSPARITFLISPPFWNTWLFYAILIIAFLLFAILVLFWGLKRSREKAHMNKQRLINELKVLRAQMNPHFTFNTLSSIQHFIGRNDNDAAMNYLSKFAKLMRSIMENTKKSSIPVKDEISALKLYMDLERLRLNERFDYNIEIDPEIDEQYDQIPSLLIQPYVENAIWHGFKNKEGTGMINLTLKRKENFIICTIEDNGIGREASKKMNGTRKNHNSMGMEITRERLEIINALKNSPLSVTITDLKNDTGDAAGTKVEIFIPMEE